MASVHRKDGTKYWHCKFSLPDGTRCLRSTKETDKSKALQICFGYEKASRMKATSDQAARVLADIVKVVSGDAFESVTAHAYFDRWLARTKMEVKDSTQERYSRWVTDLKKSIPAHAAMAHVTLSALVEARDVVARRNTIATANQFGKGIKMIWKSAFNDGKIAENVAEKLTPLNPKREQEEKVRRRPFTLEEVERLLDVINPDEEWFGMVLFGVYSGQRLGDIARARATDIKDGVWCFRSRKTGLDMRVALAMPAIRWIKEHGPKGGFLFPKCAVTPRSGTLSNRFHTVMVRAGIVPTRSHKRKKEAKEANHDCRKYAQSAVSFHCFRHTTQTWLMEAGASRELAMAHIGHEDEDTSRGYTHIGPDALREFVAKLPDFSKRRAG